MFQPLYVWCLSILPPVQTIDLSRFICDDSMFLNLNYIVFLCSCTHCRVMAVLDPVKVVITNIPAPEVKHWSSCTIVVHYMALVVLRVSW